MKLLQKAVLALAMAVFAITGWAADIEAKVDFLDGKLYCQSGAAWEKIDIGDVVPGDSVLRLGTESNAVIRLNMVTLTLTAPGDYALAAISGQAARMKRSGFFDLSAKLFAAAMSKNGSAQASAVAGVRGADAGYADLQWSGEDDAEPSAKGASDIIFKDAYNCYANGDAAGALALLAKYDAGKDKRRLSDAIELTALLKVSTFDPSGALDVINRGIPSISHPKALRGLYYLGFVAYTILHDDKGAADYYRKAQEISADNELSALDANALRETREDK
jgi:hypothetical protein